MPRSIETTLTCPCGTTFTSTSYQVVNVTLEPRLLYRLLAGALNVSTCPNCGRQAETAQAFFYHDMKRSLLAYVSAQSDVPEDEREALLDELKRVYNQAVEESEQIALRRGRRTEAPRPTVRRSRPYDDISARLEPDVPPMQVIFGVDQLVALVESLLEPEEKLGRVALTARNAGPAEQERLLQIARTMADKVECDVSVDDDPDGYSVSIYGPRGRIDVLAKALGRG